MKDRPSRLKITMGAAVPFVVFLVDFWSKRMVEARLVEGKSLRVMGDFFQFTLVHNYGTTFGLFGGSAPFLAISLVKLIFILALVVCVVKVRTFIAEARRQLVARICLLAVIGGSAGNLVDRLLDRRVTDFIDVGIRTLRWPVFNLADVFQVVGGLAVLGIVLSQYLKAKDV